MRGRKIRTLLMGILGFFIFTLVLAPSSALAKLDASTKKEIDAYIDSKMGEKKSWLPSMKGEFFELHGEMELEFVSTQNEEGIIDRSGNPHRPLADHHTDNKKPHFQMDKIVLMPIGHFGKHNMLKMELEWSHDGDSGTKVAFQDVYFQSNFLLGENAPLDMDLWVRIGRDERWMKPSRITESYPYLGTVIWRDDELQLVIGVDTEFIYWRGSFGSGFDLGTRALGEDGSFESLQDDSNFSQGEQKREFSTGIGVRYEEEEIKADLLTYYINDKMNNEENSDGARTGDVQVLQGLANYDKLESGKPTPNQNRLGTRLTLNALGATWMSEYVYMQDGLLKRHVWYSLLGYKHKLDGFDVNGRKWLTGIMPLIRYDNLDVIIQKSSSDSRTWDRWGMTLGLIIDVIEHVKLKTELIWNKEHTGGGNRIDNNEFLTQLEVKF